MTPFPGISVEGDVITVHVRPGTKVRVIVEPNTDLKVTVKS